MAPPPSLDEGPLPAEQGGAPEAAAAPAQPPAATEVAPTESIAAKTSPADALTAPAAGGAAAHPPAPTSPLAEAAVKAEEGSATADVKQEDGVKEEPTGEAAVAALYPPSDEMLVARLRQLLTEVDLNTTTEKHLRSQLEGEYGVTLADRKKLLRSEINAYLEAAQDSEGEGEGKGEEGAKVNEEVEEEGDEEMGEAEPSGSKRKAAGSSLGSYLSPEMQDFLGVERLPRTQVVKRVWEYIKEHGLQNPKDKRVILYDDKLKSLFSGTGTKCTMFTLQKHLSKHCKTSEVVGASESDSGEEDEEGRPAKKKARKASGPKASKSGSGAAEDGKERKPTGFTKQCQLSPKMAAWVGKPAASRPEITKHFWAYCKERGLQDPSDKSFILADSTLKSLAGETRFKGFGFSKLIKEHIL